jgi:hypothetical protein
MARIQYASQINSLKGHIGGLVFQNNFSSPICKLRSRQLPRGSDSLFSSQHLFKQCRTLYNALDPTIKADWVAFGNDHQKTNYFGEDKNLNGFNWFISINSLRQLRGLYPLSSPPAYVVSQNSSFVYTYWSAAYLNWYAYTSGLNTPVYFYIFASPPRTSQSLLTRDSLRLIKIVSTSDAYFEADLINDYSNIFNIGLYLSDFTGFFILFCASCIEYNTQIPSTFSTVLTPFSIE